MPPAGLSEHYTLQQMIKANVGAGKKKHSPAFNLISQNESFIL